MRDIRRRFSLDTLSIQNTTLRGFSDEGKGSVSDITLFESLGFDCVESIDYSDHENSTYVHDFNFPVPDVFHEKYDAIFDGGTLEHIFNFPESLRNIYKLLKVGEVVIHESPNHNHVDHGFYMFSPTVFYDYYSSNGFEIIKSYIFEHERPHDEGEWRIYDYKPGCIDHLSCGGWGDDEMGVWFVARKLETSSCDVIPQQGAYLREWSRIQNGQFDDLVSESAVSGSALSRTKAFVKSNRLLYSLVIPILKYLRKPPKPPIIARY